MRPDVREFVVAAQKEMGHIEEKRTDAQSVAAVDAQQASTFAPSPATGGVSADAQGHAADDDDDDEVDFGEAKDEDSDDDDKDRCNMALEAVQSKGEGSWVLAGSKKWGGRGGERGGEERCQGKRER